MSGLIATAALLAACTSDGNPGTASSPGSTAFSPTGDFDAPAPNEKQGTAVLARLRALDPDLVTDPSDALRRAGNVCRQIYVRKSDDAALVRYVREEFGDAGRFPSVNDATKIITIVRSTFCSG